MGRILHERKRTVFLFGVLFILTFAVFCMVGVFVRVESESSLYKGDFYVDAGAMYETSDIGKPESLYFMMDKNALPYDKTAGSYKPTSIDAIKLVRGGKTSNIANLNVGVIFKWSSYSYEFILPPWSDGEVVLEVGDALIIDGEFYGDRTGYTLKISKTRITKTKDGFLFDYSFDEDDEESEENSSGESMEGESGSEDSLPCDSEETESTPNSSENEEIESKPNSSENEEIESEPNSTESEEVDGSSNGNDSSLGGESEEDSSTKESEESLPTVDSESDESVSSGDIESETASESDDEESEETSELETAESETENGGAESESDSGDGNFESETLSQELENISKTESVESNSKSESEKTSLSQSKKKRGCMLSLSGSIAPLSGIVLPLVFLFKRKANNKNKS